MTTSKEKSNTVSLSELEQIEGNYYKMDLFVSSSLVLFTIWVFLSEKNFAWTVFLGILALLFLIRGIKNWKEKGLGKKSGKAEE